MAGRLQTLAHPTIGRKSTPTRQADKVLHTGTVNNNNQGCYQYDKADNRTNVTTTVNSASPCP